MSEDGQPGLEEQRVFAAVSRAMLGAPVPAPRIGRFEIRERLGAGGMGEVYGAYDPDEDREVAVKVLASDRAADGAALGRMQREARALQRLRHPNVVEVFAVGDDDGRTFIAMERLAGDSLEALLAEHRSLPPQRVVEVLGDVCRGIAAAHDASIVHRDLKPANIFVHRGAERWTAKVLDFGVAKGLSSATLGGSTASGTVLGTPYYMSPEQARDASKVDRRADLWAVAIIAFECVVGRRPYEATNMPDLAVKILTERPPIPSEHGTVPPGLDAWFARATATDPNDRWPSAQALSDTLATALLHDTPSAPRPHHRRILLAVLLILATITIPVREPTPDVTPERVLPTNPDAASHTPWETLMD
ncbi:MAG: serine/threonine-protein kinase, partial [Myxococcota bacterium]